MLSVVQQKPEQLYHLQMVYTISQAKQELSLLSPMLARAIYSASSLVAKQLLTITLASRHYSLYLVLAKREQPHSRSEKVLSSLSAVLQKELHTYQVYKQMSTSLVSPRLSSPSLMLDLVFCLDSTLQQSPEQSLTRTSQSSTSSVRSNQELPKHLLVLAMLLLEVQQQIRSPEHLILVRPKFRSLVQQTRASQSTHQRKAQKSQPMAKRKFFAPSVTREQVNSRQVAMQSSVFASGSLVLDLSRSESSLVTPHFSPTSQTFTSFLRVLQQLSRSMLLHHVPMDGLFNGINKTGILN